MSPKTATIISLIALLSLTVTLSTAKAKCVGFESVPDVLKHYGLPSGLFPNNTQSFSCKPVPDTNALALSIRLQGLVCRVTRESDGVKFVLRYRRRISAIVSRRELTNLKGVRLNLVKPEFALLRVSEVRVFGIVRKFVRVNSASGINSPLLPFSSFPSEPPSCDTEPDSNPSYDNVDAEEDNDHEVHQNNHEQDVSKWVLKNYGRLLSLVA